MSKKMLKRSLALGALMAFVITGQAWAKEIENVGTYQTVLNATDSDKHLVAGGEEFSQTGGAPIWIRPAYQSVATINGWDTITFNGTNFTSTAPDSFEIVFYTNSGQASMTLNGVGTIQTNISDEQNKNVAFFYSQGGTIDVDATKVDVQNVKYGVRLEVSGGSGSVLIDADDVTLDASGYGIQISDAVSSSSCGFVDINAKNKLNIIGETAAIYSNYGVDNIINVDGKEVFIKGGSYGAVYAYQGPRINIGKDSGKVDVEGDITAWTNSTIDVNLGTNGSLNGEIWSIDNSKVTIDLGTNSIFNGITGTFYQGYANGSIDITLGSNSIWNLSSESSLTTAEFAKDSVLSIDGATYVNNNDKNESYALNGVGSDASLIVEKDAKLKIKGIEKGSKYNIAKGFNNALANGKNWTIDNNLLTGEWAVVDDGLQVTTVNKDAEDIVADMNVSSSTAQSLADVTKAAQQAGVTGNKEGTGTAKAVALVEAIANAPSEVAGQVYESVSKMAEAGGNSATAASIVKNVTGVTNDRLSFNCGHSAPHKGGHGVGLFEEGSGADVWVEYVHGKDEVEDMPSTAGATSYEGKYNGIVMGVDFKKVNKFQSGIAFNYGEGDTNSVGSAARTHSDYDFWGIGYYGNIHNDDSNVIFDIGYAKTDSDVENTNEFGVNFKASPETTTWTAGVKLEKLYQNENVQIVPYTGLRFMSIDPDDYSTECASASYKMERQNVWLLPLGVSIKQEVTNDNGWTVSPRVDLSYIWAFGDTDSEMEFSTLGTKTNIGYEVMDDGSFLGLVGIEAHKGQWGFGISYSYQKGDYSTSKKWYIDANYSF